MMYFYQYFLKFFYTKSLTRGVGLLLMGIVLNMGTIFSVMADDLGSVIFPSCISTDGTPCDSETDFEPVIYPDFENLSTNCNAVTEVSTIECESLLELYNSTDGANWTNNDGWNLGNTPCSWYGVTCEEGQVTKIWLWENDLNGSIPIELGQLSNLTSLSLYSNQLSGSIPVELGQLSNLTDLFLYSNQLSGLIPVELGQLSNLTGLGLSYNQLSGSIPIELGQLSNLTWLYLHYNQLSGSIPDFGHLSKLKTILLGNEICKDTNINYSAWQIENKYSDVTWQEQLDELPYCPSDQASSQFCTSGNININNVSNNCSNGNCSSSGIKITCNSESCQWCDANNNCENILYNGITQISGGSINCSNGQCNYSVQNGGSSSSGNFSCKGNIPPNQVGTDCNAVTEISTIECQSLLELYNSTDGANWTNNEGWNLTNTPCSWYGVTCENRGVTKLSLFDNQLSGSIPVELGQLSNLTKLFLYGNQLSGFIPVELGQLSNLTELYLSVNKLSGSIPVELGQLNNLTFLYLGGNQLSGSIPVELGQLSNLTFLYLYGSQLSGSIPVELGQLSNLTYLALSNNQLSGSIPVELRQLSNLTSLFLGDNQLSGSIPDFGHLSKLKTIGLLGNEICKDNNINYSAWQIENKYSDVTWPEQLAEFPFCSSSSECTYEITPTNRIHEADSTMDRVTITTPSHCEWEATSNDESWLKVFLSHDAETEENTSERPIIKRGKGQGNGNLTYSISENKSGAERTGIITIEDKDVVITQKSKLLPTTTPTIRIEPTTLNFDNAQDIRSRLRNAKNSEIEIHKISSNQELFVETDMPIDENPADPTISRLRNMEINLDALSQLDATFGIVYTDKVTLNLFPEVSYTVNNTSINYRGANDYTWIGKIEGMQFGDVILVVKDSKITGNVNAQGEVYRIRSSQNGLHSIQKMNAAAFPKNGPSPSISTSYTPLSNDEKQRSQRRRIRATSDKPIIDVMVVYTPAAARTSTSNNVDIESEIQLAIDETNQAYANSNIKQILRLVHTEQINYTESGYFNTDIDKLTRKDGVIDNVHDLRDNYKADLVNLWVAEGDYCGLAWSMFNNVDVSFEINGFSIIARDCATAPTYAFAHELGHNMGAHHAMYETGGESGAYKYSHGYAYDTGNKNTSWRTIMAYEDQCTDQDHRCPRIPYFSNPNIEYNRVAIGDSSSANNVLTLNNTADIVASFRESAKFLAGDAKNFTVYNDGDADLLISAISLENNALRGITVTPNNVTITPGKSVVITVKLDYSKVPTGQTNNRLLISSNDPNNTAYPINIVINRQTDSGANVAADSYDTSLNELSVTASAFGEVYQAILNPIELLPEIVGSLFNLGGAIEVSGEFLDEQLTTYDPETGIVQIPIGSTYLANGEPILFVVEMKETSAGTFEVTNFTIIPVQAIE